MGRTWSKSITSGYNWFMELNEVVDSNPGWCNWAEAIWWNHWRWQLQTRGFPAMKNWGGSKRKEEKRRVKIEEFFVNLVNLQINSPSFGPKDTINEDTSKVSNLFLSRCTLARFFLPKKVLGAILWMVLLLKLISFTLGKIDKTVMLLIILTLASMYCKW